ncbi:MAG: hypothetical protein ACR2QC_12735 [Gammaproteobacteria bacterium]
MYNYPPLRGGGDSCLRRNGTVGVLWNKDGNPKHRHSGESRNLIRRKANRLRFRAKEIPAFAGMAYFN